MPQAIWTESAQTDLKEIAFHIGVNDARLSVAEKLIRDIHEKLFNMHISH